MYLNTHFGCIKNKMGTKIIHELGKEPIQREETAEELAQRETDRANDAVREQAILDAKTANDNLKSSAKAKLMAGEALTEAEADTIVL